MSVWKHLALLGRANSKESIEYILEALWRTRKTGLDAADRQIFGEMLQLPNDSDLDPLQGDATSSCEEKDVQFQLTKGTLETMLKSMYSVRSHLSDDVQMSDRS